MIQITDHLGQIRARVTQALIGAGRHDQVKLVAVSKQQSAADIRELFNAGVSDFGESYAAEALAKQAELAGLAITWHFIGRIQANKSRSIANSFSWVHSVDRVKIAQRLNDQRPFDADPLNTLVQVNLAGESQKGGITEDAVAELAHCIDELPRLRYRGLMTIPPAGLQDADVYALFTRLRGLNETLNQTGLSGDTLSMGMSRDFEIAIAAGSNCVRIGTALFGARPKPNP